MRNAKRQLWKTKDLFLFFFKDIRSFFNVISKKGNNESTTHKHKAKAVVESDNDEIIPETPPSKKQKLPSKKRKVQVLSSDSEDEKKQNSKAHKENKKSVVEEKKLKPVSNLGNAFGSSPVKQKKAVTVKSSTEKQETKADLVVNNDSAFEKTLLDLDNELLEQNADFLDKTVEEALAKDSKTSNLNDSAKGIPYHFVTLILMQILWFRKNTKTQTKAQ